MARGENLILYSMDNLLSVIQSLIYIDVLSSKLNNGRIFIR